MKPIALRRNLLNAFLPLFAFMFAVLFAYAARAQTKDWTLTEELDPILQTQVCKASTTVAKPVPTPKPPTPAPPAPPSAIKLSLSFPKDFSSLPTITFEAKGQVARARTAMLRLATKEFQPLFLLKAAATADEADIYYYAPAALPRVLELIAAASTLDLVLDPKGAPVPVRVSLAGSSATIDLVEKCLKTKTLLPTEFLTALNQKFPFSGALPSEINGQVLMGVVDKAYKDYLSGKSLTASLAALRKAMKALAAQETEAAAVLKDKQARLERTAKALADRRAQAVAVDEQIARAKSDLERLEKESVVSHANLQAKKAVYDPVFAQIEPFQKDYRARKSILDEIDEAIESHKSQISNGERKVSALRSEASQLSRQIPDLDREISPLQSQRSRLDSDIASFNIDWEKRKILSSDWRYNDLKRKEDELQRSSQEARREENQAQRRVMDLQSQLNACRARPAPQDCAPIENQLSQAQSAHSSAQSRERQIQSERESVQRDRDGIEVEAERKAISVREGLVQQRDRILSQLSDLEARKAHAETRLRLVLNSEIPSVESEINSSRNALPGLQSQRPSAQAASDAAKQRLADIRKQTDFDRIEGEYLAARDANQRILNAIENTRWEIANAERDRRTIATEIASLQTDLERKTAERDGAAQKLAAIQAQLAPQRQQEQAQQTQLDQAKQGLADGRALYQELYKKLSE